MGQKCLDLYLMTILFSCFYTYGSLPLPDDIFTKQGQWEYLKKYKHVPASLNTQERTASAPTDAAFATAVRSYQRFFKLPQTGVMDAPTLNLMSQDRCSTTDDNESERQGRFSLQGSSWRLNQITYQLSGAPTGSAPNQCAARARLINAFEVWQYAIARNFTEVASGPNIDVLYASGYHGDRSPFDGPGKTLAHAYFPSNGGDIHMDADDNFADSLYTASSKHSLLLIYIHEIGHSLGLGHSGDINAIMWPYMYRGKRYVGLGSDDLEGIRKLYGTRQRPSAATSQSCVENTSDGTGGGAPCVFPFVYKGFTFNECTTLDHTKKWCSTREIYQGGWGNCIGCLPVTSSSSCGPDEREGTFAGSAYGAPCVFPFNYNGKVYNKCTSVDHFRPWCSTTTDFQGCWGNCAGCQKLPELSPCEETTVDGRTCIFPFFYKDKIYYKCTTDDHHRPWCSLTALYDNSWSNCQACQT